MADEDAPGSGRTLSYHSSCTMVQAFKALLQEKIPQIPNKIFADREWQAAKSRAAVGKGASPDPKWEVALHVTNKFDEEGRDRVIFALLNNTDDSLKISAMECLSGALATSRVPRVASRIASDISSSKKGRTPPWPPCLL